MDDQLNRQDEEEGRGGNARCVVGIIIYVSIFFAPYLITGATSLLPSYQDESQWLLYHDFINKSYARGFFPLWTPDLFCGMPFLAWSHSAALYPLNIIFAVMDFGSGVWVSQWAHAIVFGLGLFYLCRKLGTGKWGAMLAVAVGSALFIFDNLANFVPNLRTGSFVPWLFLAIIGLLVERRFKYLGWFILINLLMYLGGQIELIGVSYELVSVVLIGAGVYFRGRWKEVLAAYVLFAAAFALSFVAAQVQSLPTLELTSQSIRAGGLTYNYFKIWSAETANVSAWMPYIASGMVMVCLASALAGIRRSIIVGLGVLGFVFCLCLIHDLLGVLWVLYRIPVLKGLLAHSRIFIDAKIILAVMIGVGAGSIFRSSRQSSWLMAIGVLSLGVAAVWWGFVSDRADTLFPANEPNMQGAMSFFIRAMDVGMLVQAAIGLLLLFSPWIIGRWKNIGRWSVTGICLGVYSMPVLVCLPHHHPDAFGFPKKYTRFMDGNQGLHRVQTVYAWDRWDRIGIPMQTGILQGTRSADGFITVSVDRYTRLLNAIIPGTFREEKGKIADLEATKVFKEGAFISAGNVPFLNLLGIKYLVTEQKNIKFASHYFLGYPDSPLLARGSEARGERRYTPDGLEDAVRFKGRAGCLVHIQAGDRLEFKARSDSAGRWWMVMTGPVDGAGARLELAKWSPGKDLASPMVDLHQADTGNAEISFYILDNKGGAAEGELINPVIVNQDKYFKRTPLDAPFNIFKNPGAMPPTFLVSRVQAVKRQDALASMSTPGFDPLTMAVAEGPGLANIRSLPFLPREGVRVMSYTPETIKLQAATAAPRLAVLTDVWFPGWRVWVDDVEQPILPVDLALRGIVLDQGVHQITMKYDPRSFHLGLWITIASLASLLVAAIWKKIF